MSKLEYVVLCASVVGTDGQFETAYHFDGHRFGNRRAAISHGFRLRESDDFNIGVLRNGKLVSIDWMDKPVDTEMGVLTAAASSAGLLAPCGSR